MQPGRRPTRVLLGVMPPRPSRALRPVRRLLALLGCCWLLAVPVGAAWAQEAAPAGFEITVDQGRALFELTGLVPGPIGSRCLVVEARNGSAETVFVSAQVVGSLASYLSIDIEAGDATDPATCGGFSGSMAFRGTLAELGSQYADASAGLPIALGADNRVVLRFSLSLASDDTAQGKRVELSFGFHATDTTPPTTTPPTTEAPTTTEEPTTTITVPGTVPATTAPATTVATTVVGSSPEPAVPPTTVATSTSTTRTDTRPPVPTDSGGAGQGGATAGGGNSPATPDIVVVDDGTTGEPSIGERAAEAVKAGVEAAVTAADVTARTTVVPGAFSAVALAFFLLQGRLERSDPKLADAPLEPDDDLPFEPRFEVSA